MPNAVDLIIYSRPGCHLCDEMKALVGRVAEASRLPARIEDVNVESDRDLENRFGLEVPVLLLNGKKVAKYRIAEEELRRLLIAAGTGEAG